MRHITRQLLIGSAAALAVALAATAALAEQPVPIDANVQQWEALDANTVLVLSAEDNKLWLEYAPFGTMPPVPCFAPNTNVQQFGCRILIDANVRSSWPLNLNTVFVVGSDYNLWLEFGPFGTVPLPECVYPNSQQCRYWIASGAASCRCSTNTASL